MTSQRQQEARSRALAAPLGIVSLLRHRERAGRSSFNNHALARSSCLQKSVDNDFGKIGRAVRVLRESLDKCSMGSLTEENWSNVESAVTSMLSTILDAANCPHDQQFIVTPKKRQQREVFVALGGMQELLRLFDKPFVSKNDARLERERYFSRRAELWNDTLTVLREVSYAIPTLADQAFSDDHVIFLFSLLSSNSLFESVMVLLEEVLAGKKDTFCLSKVPKFFDLVKSFSIRKLTQFCRLLSLVLFEPEDRQIMEGSHVLGSLELLQLRKDRMDKLSNIVERNQSLIVSNPGMLQRLVQLLRIVNYGPSIAELGRQSPMQMPFNQVDIIQYLTPQRNLSEWDRVAELFKIDEEAEAGAPTARTFPEHSSSSAGARSNVRADVMQMSQMLFAFETISDNFSGSDDYNVMDNIVNMVREFGVSEGAEQSPLEDRQTSNDAAVVRALSSDHLLHSGDYLPILRRNLTVRRRQRQTPLEARRELQFFAILLAPHQVELLFVFSTLLSGRRKIDVQNSLGALGLGRVLGDMFERMSWDSLECAEQLRGGEPHGPGCECGDPESALRVQCLRLIHNFYDRDFVGNMNKQLVLSDAENSLLRSYRGNEERCSREGHLLASSDKGLLSRIIVVLNEQPQEGIYRFWLTTCLEAFLRGSSSAEQLFVAKSGLLAKIVSSILECGASSNPNMQSAFDVLGEAVKGNRYTLEMLEASLSDADFKAFADVVMSNLIDSNVFVRSLFMSAETVRESARRGTARRPSPERPGYLTHTWVHFTPRSLLPPASANSQPARKRGKASPVCIAAPPLARREGEVDDDALDDMLFGTPPEQSTLMAFAGESAAMAAAVSGSSSAQQQEGDDFNNYALLPLPLRRAGSADEGSASRSPLLPPSLFRLSLFLQEEREHMLVKLMSIVTIKSVNHENICCLNTALLILILANKNGQLCEVLQRVRSIADNTFHNNLRISAKCTCQPVTCLACYASGDGALLLGGEEQDSAKVAQCWGLSAPGSHVLMRNFRELLWYWSEYYLRRGRDRLSIEFSCHIPFAYWLGLVELLCRDDGSPAALLKRPMQLPRSPYHGPSKSSMALPSRSP